MIAQIRSEQPPYPGYLYVPDTPGPHPGILLLHGSEGGYGDFWSMPGEKSRSVGEAKYTVKMAKHFASLGYVAYTYAYFHADSIKGFSSYPPSELVNIDMRNTAQALAWLKSCSYVQGRPVGLYGGSRGAEHALILASLLPQLKELNATVDVVIASSPSDFVYPGFSREAADALSSGAPFPENFPSAWSFDGKPIEMYSPIEIEKITSPVFITYGAIDPIWGPYVDAQKLHQRLISHGAPSMHYDFRNSEDPKALMDLIVKNLSAEKSSAKAIFIRFIDEGHSAKPHSNSSLLESMMTEFFLKTYLHTCGS